MFRIDVHQHILPKKYRETLETNNIIDSGGIPIPTWSEDLMLEHMDSLNIKAAITSVSDPGVYFGNIQHSADLARSCNEFSAELVAKYPKRIGAFAVLPLKNVDSALKELEYALKILKLDGIILLSNNGENYLGHSSFEPILAELDKMKSIVFIHPTNPIGYQKDLIKIPTATYEFVFDTTRTVVDLLLAGRFQQFPNVKFIVAHAGGTIPYIAGRLALAELMQPTLKEKIKIGIINTLKNLYYDTTLSTSSFTLKCLLDFVPHDHILFGSDFPFAPSPVIKFKTMELDNNIKTINELEEKIFYKNAEVLFPRFSDQSTKK